MKAYWNRLPLSERVGLIAVAFLFPAVFLGIALVFGG